MWLYRKSALAINLKCKQYIDVFASFGFGFKQQLTVLYTLYIEMGMMRNGYARDDSILIYTV